MCTGPQRDKRVLAPRGFLHRVRILIAGAAKSMQNRGTAAALTLPGAEMDFQRADSPAGGKQCNKREGQGD